MKSRLAAAVVAVVALSATAFAASASAAILTLGPPLAATNVPSTDCSVDGGCTFTHFALAGGALPASPVDGAIVSWSVKGASAKPGYAIRVLTRSGENLTASGTSARQTPAGPALQTFATVLPIKKGQLIGIDIPKGGNFGVGAAPGDTLAEVSPSPVDGTTNALTGEFPDTVVPFGAQVQPAPTVAALSVTSGLPAGGTPVTITGTDFEGTTAVKFGAVPATFAVSSETSITATAPAGAPGAVPVTVTTIAGTATSAQPFTYAAPPTCRVPRLRGKTLKSAKKRIRGADCRVGKLTKKEGATAKNGEVVKQVPKPGVTVPADTKVKVTLAP